MGKTSLMRDTLRGLDAAGEVTPLFVDLEDARDPQDAIAEVAAATTQAQRLWGASSVACNTSAITLKM